MVDQSSHRLRQTCGCRRPVGVVGVPSLEEFHNLTTIRVVGFDGLNPFDRIATAKRYKRIAAPFRPLLETAERPARFEV
jgi:hypothetical protein